MFLLIDNQDSFTYNLYSYFKILNQNIEVIDSRDISAEILSKKEFITGIIISPGPKSPHECKNSCDIVSYFFDKTPILGVCLGHQILGHVFGAKIEKGIMPMHGKISTVSHNESKLFFNIPKNFKVTRYHSLVISNENLPNDLNVDAYSEDNVIMSISHKIHPIFGVQFHPEAVLTENGFDLIQNFINICDLFHKARFKYYENNN